MGVSLASFPKEELPTTLHNQNQNPMSNYSKAPGVFPSSRR